MIKTIGILIIAAFMVISEVPPLIEKKQTKEVITFFVLLVFGVVLSILIALDIAVPNPMDFLTNMLKPLSKMISK